MAISRFYLTFKIYKEEQKSFSVFFNFCIDASLYKTRQKGIVQRCSASGKREKRDMVGKATRESEDQRARGEFRVFLTPMLELIVFISARGKRIKAVS